MWINPENSDLFIQSNDGGANVTHNGGKSWSTQFNQPTSEIYQVEVDNQFPYWLYGGQQDNYSTVSVPSMPPYGIQAPGIGYIINTGGCETRLRYLIRQIPISYTQIARVVLPFLIKKPVRNSHFM